MSEFLDCVGLIRLCEDINQFEDILVDIGKGTVILYTLLDNETCNVYNMSLKSYQSALKLKSTSGKHVLSNKWHRQDLIEAIKHPTDNASEEDIRKALEGIES